MTLFSKHLGLYQRVRQHRCACLTTAQCSPHNPARTRLLQAVNNIRNEKKRLMNTRKKNTEEEEEEGGRLGGGVGEREREK